MKKPLVLLSAWALCAAFATLSAAVVIKNSAAETPVAIGQGVTFTVSGLSTLKAPGNMRLVTNVSEVVEIPALPAGEDIFVYTTTAAVPGTLMFAVDTGKGFKHKGYRDSARSGVVVAPEKVVSSLKSAPDVAEYWQGIKDALKGVSAEPNLQLVETKDGVELYTFEIDAGGGELGTSDGVKAIGYMAKPVGDGPFPVLVNFHGAGTFFGRPETTWDYAKMGIMCWSMNPHPLPNNLTDAERSQLRKGILKDYAQVGKEGPREAVYFNGMFKRAYQVVQAIKQNPQWDKKHLVLHGFSQGGAQTIATGYLASDVVTAIAPGGPALVDIAGNLDGRAPGWPYWVKTRDSQPYEMARTFDLLNLAPLMHLPMALAVGVHDATCPAAAQMAFYNLYAGPKELIFMYNCDHNTNTKWAGIELAFIKKHLGLK